MQNAASSASVMPGYALITGGELKVFGLHMHPSSLL